MPKQSTVWFGNDKAVQGIQLEHNDDGSAKLGVTVWVPLGGEPPRFRSVVCAIDITSDHLRAIAEATKG